MIMEIAQTSDYLILFLITVLMVGFSRFFAYKVGSNLTDRVVQQERMQELQREMLEAQKNNDMQRVMELRDESMEMMQGMMKKQILPMCIRSGIFLGLFAILGLFYGGLQFDKNPIQIFGPGYSSLYFVYSLGISLLIALIRYLYRKITGKEKEEKFIDRAQVMRSNINLNQPSSMNGGSMGSAMNFSSNANMSPQMQDLRKQLLEKRNRGEIPADINIDEELHNMTEATEDELVESDLQDAKSVKSWKMKAALAKKTINIAENETETIDKELDDQKDEDER